MEDEFLIAEFQEAFGLRQTLPGLIQVEHILDVVAMLGYDSEYKFFRNCIQIIRQNETIYIDFPEFHSIMIQFQEYVQERNQSPYSFFDDISVNGMVEYEQFVWFWENLGESMDDEIQAILEEWRHESGGLVSDELVDKLEALNLI